jgi:hypothetical protein
MFDSRLFEDTLPISKLYISLDIPTQSKRNAVKKIAIYRQFILYQFELNPDIKPFLHGIPDFKYYNDLKTVEDDLYKVVSDIKSILDKYEKLVISKCIYPAGGETDPMKIIYHERVLEVYDFWVKVEIMDQRSASDSVQDCIARRYKLLEVFRMINSVSLSWN